MALFREINNCLDNLTNGSYVPMPLIAEISKKKKDIETINMEEKTPITVTSSNTIQPKKMFETNHKNFLADAEKTASDNQRSHRIAKQKIRNNITDKRRKELVKTLEFKGQTKYEYNLVNKAKKDVDHQHSNSTQERTNLTKSSDFFKVLQSNKPGAKRQPEGDNDKGGKSSKKLKVDSIKL